MTVYTTTQHFSYIYISINTCTYVALILMNGDVHEFNILWQEGLHNKMWLKFFFKQSTYLKQSH